MSIRDDWPLQTYQRAPNFKVRGRITRLKNAVQLFEGLLRQDVILAVSSSPARAENISPQILLFEFHNDDIATLSGLRAGEDIEVHFIIQGRVSNKTGITKHFVSLQGFEVYKIDELGDAILPNTTSNETIMLSSRQGGLPIETPDFTPFPITLLYDLSHAGYDEK